MAARRKKVESYEDEAPAELGPGRNGSGPALEVQGHQGAAAAPAGAQPAAAQPGAPGVAARPAPQPTAGSLAATAAHATAGSRSSVTGSREGSLGASRQGSLAGAASSAGSAHLPTALPVRHPTAAAAAAASRAPLAAHAQPGAGLGSLTGGPAAAAGRRAPASGLTAHVPQRAQHQRADSASSAGPSASSSLASSPRARLAQAVATQLYTAAQHLPAGEPQQQHVAAPTSRPAALTAAAAPAAAGQQRERGAALPAARAQAAVVAPLKQPSSQAPPLPTAATAKAPSQGSRGQSPKAAAPAGVAPSEKITGVARSPSSLPPSLPPSHASSAVTRGGSAGAEGASPSGFTQRAASPTAPAAAAMPPAVPPAEAALAAGHKPQHQQPEAFGSFMAMPSASGGEEAPPSGAPEEATPLSAAALVAAGPVQPAPLAAQQQPSAPAEQQHSPFEAEAAPPAGTPAAVGPLQPPQQQQLFASPPQLQLPSLGEVALPFLSPIGTSKDLLPEAPGPLAEVVGGAQAAAAAAGGPTAPAQQPGPSPPKQPPPEQPQQAAAVAEPVVQEEEEEEEPPPVATTFAVASGPLFGGGEEEEGGFFFGGGSGGSSSPGAAAFGAPDAWLQQERPPSSFTQPTAATSHSSSSSTAPAQHPVHHAAALPPPPQTGAPGAPAAAAAPAQQGPHQADLASSFAVEPEAAPAGRAASFSAWQVPPAAHAAPAEPQQAQQEETQALPAPGPFRQTLAHPPAPVAPQQQQRQQQQRQQQQRQQQQPGYRDVASLPDEASHGWGVAAPGAALEPLGQPTSVAAEDLAPSFGLPTTPVPWQPEQQVAEEAVPAAGGSAEASTWGGEQQHLPPAAEAAMASAQPAATTTWQQASWGQAGGEDDGAAFFGEDQPAAAEQGWGTDLADSFMPAAPSPWQPAPPAELGQPAGVGEVGAGAAHPGAAAQGAGEVQAAWGASAALAERHQQQQQEQEGMPAAQQWGEPGAEQGPELGVTAEPTLWAAGMEPPGPASSQAEQAQQEAVPPAALSGGWAGVAGVAAAALEGPAWAPPAAAALPDGSPAHSSAAPAAQPEAPAPAIHPAAAEPAATTAAGEAAGPALLPNGEAWHHEPLPGEEGFTSPRATGGIPFQEQPPGEGEGWDLESPKVAAPQPAEPAGKAASAASGPATEAAPGAAAAGEGTTWWGEDGYCYLDAPDGWRYYWEEPGQQWVQYQQLAQQEQQQPQQSQQPSQEGGGGGGGAVAATFEGGAAAGAEPVVGEPAPVTAEASAEGLSEGAPGAASLIEPADGGAVAGAASGAAGEQQWLQQGWQPGAEATGGEQQAGAGDDLASSFGLEATEAAAQQPAVPVLAWGGTQGELAAPQPQLAPTVFQPGAQSVPQQQQQQPLSQPPAFQQEQPLAAGGWKPAVFQPTPPGSTGPQQPVSGQAQQAGGWVPTVFQPSPPASVASQQATAWAPQQPTATQQPPPAAAAAFPTCTAAGPFGAASPAAATPGVFDPSAAQTAQFYSTPPAMGQQGPYAGGPPATIDYNDPSRTHWRPPACFGKLAFGGRLLVVTPSGQLTLHSMAALPGHMLQPLPGAALPPASLSELQTLASAFPGPLTNSTSRDKVAKFAAEQVEACSIEEPHSPDPAGLQTLWACLRVLAQFQGNVRSAPYGRQKPADEASSPEAALAAALLDPLGAAGPGALAAGAPDPMAHPGALAPAGPPGAAAAVQELLLAGRRLEALRVATEAQLWGVALLVARLLGEQAVSETAAAMAQQCLAPGAPLRTLCLLLASGAEGALGLPPGGGGAGRSPPTSVGGSAGPLQPGPAGPGAAAAGAGPLDLLAGDWRQQLAVLAANRTPGDERVMERLGERLLREAGQVLAAHACFCLAGLPLQPADAPGASFVLVGTGPASSPRCYASLPAILRTEVYTWARTVGNTALVPQYSLVLPYKLLHAALLVDLGVLPQAAQYCHNVLSVMQGLGKIPPGLLVCKAVVADLQDRLQAFASANKIGLGRSFSAGTLVSSMGKWLDRGITALMGGGTDAGSGPNSRKVGGPPHSTSGANLAGMVEGGGRPAGAPHSRSHSFSNAAESPKLADASAHQRSFSTHVPGPTSAPPSTSAFFPPGAGLPPLPRPSTGTTPPPSTGGGPASVLQPQSAATAAQQQGQAQQGQPPEQPKSLGRGMLKLVGSFKGLMSAAGPGSRGKLANGSSDGPPPPPPSEPENVFYYDEELKMWRERGAPPPVQAAPPPPPPTTATLAAQQAGNGLAPPPMGAAAMALPRGGVGSRYVNTLPQHGAAGGPAQASLLPPTGPASWSPAPAAPAPHSTGPGGTPAAGTLSPAVLPGSSTGGTGQAQHSGQSMPAMTQPPPSLQPLRIPSGPSSSIASPTSSGLVPGMKFHQDCPAAPAAPAMPPTLPGGAAAAHAPPPFGGAPVQAAQPAAAVGFAGGVPVPPGPAWAPLPTLHEASSSAVLPVVGGDSGASPMAAAAPSAGPAAAAGRFTGYAVAACNAGAAAYQHASWAAQGAATGDAGAQHTAQQQQEQPGWEQQPGAWEQGGCGGTAAQPAGSYAGWDGYAAYGEQQQQHAQQGAVHGYADAAYSTAGAYGGVAAGMAGAGGVEELTEVEL